MIYCIMLTKDRYEITKRVVEHNIATAGVPLRFIVVDNGSTDQRLIDWIPTIAYQYTLNVCNEGVARMQNTALLEVEDRASHDSYVCLFGNDILMPHNWGIDLINLYQAMSVYDYVGLVGIDCLGHAAQCKPHPLEASALMTHNVFGTCLFRLDIVWYVGYLCNGFHPYGLEDSDWHHRIAEAGRKCYYLAGAYSEHIGNDVGNDTEYRKMKDESLYQGAQVWAAQQEYYAKNKAANVPDYWFLSSDNSAYTIPNKFFRLGTSAGEEGTPGGV